MDQLDIEVGNCKTEPKFSDHDSMNTIYFVEGASRPRIKEETQDSEDDHFEVKHEPLDRECAPEGGAKEEVCNLGAGNIAIKKEPLTANVRNDAADSNSEELDLQRSYEEKLIKSEKNIPGEASTGDSNSGGNLRPIKVEEGVTVSDNARHFSEEDQKKANLHSCFDVDPKATGPTDASSPEDAPASESGSSVSSYSHLSSDEGDNLESDESTSRHNTDVNNGSHTQDAPNSWGSLHQSERAFPFTGQEEFRGTFSGSTTPLDAVKLFLSDQLVDLIVKETNLYAARTISSEQNARGLGLQSWVPCTCKEIWKFIGLKIFMTVLEFPEVALYWSDKEIFSNPFASNVMTLNRFKAISRMLHFADDSLPHSSRNYRVQPIADSLLEKFQAVYLPPSELVIDQNVLLFGGRKSYRRPLLGECELGMVLYKLCTASGYTLSFEVGRRQMTPPFDPTESTILRLMKNYLGKGYTLYTSHPYTSLPIARHLLGKRTYICGKIRPKRRGMPRQLTNAKLGDGEIRAVQDKTGVKIFKLKSERNSYTLSTVPEHTEELVETGKKASRAGPPVKKPKSLVDYKKAREGLYNISEETTLYDRHRESKKWYYKVAMELMTRVAVVNSWILFNKYTGQPYLSLDKFKRSLIHCLFKGFPLENKPRGKKGKADGSNGKESERTWSDSDSETSLLSGSGSSYCLNLDSDSSFFFNSDSDSDF